jgi:hypothetical protein
MDFDVAQKGRGSQSININKGGGCLQSLYDARKHYKSPSPDVRATIDSGTVPEAWLTLSDGSYRPTQAQYSCCFGH